MKAALLAAGIYLLSCFIGSAVGNLYLIVGDSVARGAPLPKDWFLGALGFNLFSLPYTLVGIVPIVVAAVALRLFVRPARPVLIASMILLGWIVGEWMTGDNFSKNYRYLHFGGLAGAVTAGLWTWLTFRHRGWAQT